MSAPKPGAIGGAGGPQASGAISPGGGGSASALRDSLTRILAPEGGILGPRHLPAFERLLATYTELGARQVLQHSVAQPSLLWLCSHFLLGWCSRCASRLFQTIARVPGCLWSSICMSASGW
jgi:hypothetical protein